MSLTSPGHAFEKCIAYTREHLPDLATDDEKDVPDAKKARTNPPEEANANDTAQAAEQECRICYAQPANSVIVPCGHVGACLECAVKSVEIAEKCPFCAQTVALVLQTFAP